MRAKGNVCARLWAIPQSHPKIKMKPQIKSNGQVQTLGLVQTLKSTRALMFRRARQSSDAWISVGLYTLHSDKRESNPFAASSLGSSLDPESAPKF